MPDISPAFLDRGRTFHCLVVVLAVFGLTGLPCPGAAQPVPAMFRGGPAHPGVVATRGVDRLGGLAWRFKTDGPVRSSPILAAGVVYFGSTDGRLYAVDAADGRERWRYEAGASIAGSPLVTEAAVIAIDRANRIHAVRRESGEALWQVTTGRDLPLAWGLEGWDYLLAAPTLAGDLVLAGSGDGHLYALGLRSGDLRWRFPTGGRIRSAPAIHNGVAYIGSGDGVVYGVSLSDGREVWRFETAGRALAAADWGFDRTQIYSSPTIADGVLYIGSRDASLYAIDIATREALWTYEDGSAWVIATPAVVGERVLNARSSSGKVRALDRRRGAELWSAATAGYVFSSPLVVGETVYLGSADERIYALDLASGERRWSYRTGGAVYSSPAVWQGRLYIGSDDGYLYALAATEGPQPRLAVYWDDALMGQAIWGARDTHKRVAQHFQALGYEPLDAAGLETFLSQRLEDSVPSVVMVAMDALPAAVAAPEQEAPLLRRYLEAGGKIVWMGFPPLVVVRDDSLRFVGVDRQRPSRLLGVDHAAWNNDEYGVTVTDAGRAWGLETGWVGLAGISADQPLTVLAVDEIGRAAAWAKSYGGAPGTGFVSVRVGYDEAYLDELRAVVEYGILRATANSSR